MCIVSAVEFGIQVAVCLAKMAAPASFRLLEFINMVIPVAGCIDSRYSGEDNGQSDNRFSTLVKVISQLFTSIGKKSGLHLSFKQQLTRMLTLVHKHWSTEFCSGHFEIVHHLLPSILSEVGSSV